jgi:hypothetical protein
MQNKKVTLTFTKEFIKGLLIGLTYDETMTFVSAERAEKWLENIAKSKTVNYRIIHFRIEF